MRDSIPVDPQSLRPDKKWLMAAMNREKDIEKINLELAQRYDTFSHDLYPVDVGTMVII